MNEQMTLLNRHNLDEFTIDMIIHLSIKTRKKEKKTPLLILIRP